MYKIRLIGCQFVSRDESTRSIKREEKNVLQKWNLLFALLSFFFFFFNCFPRESYNVLIMELAMSNFFPRNARWCQGNVKQTTRHEKFCLSRFTVTMFEWNRLFQQNCRTCKELYNETQYCIRFLTHDYRT